MLDKAFWDEYMRRYDKGVGTLAPYRRLLKEMVDKAQPTDEDIILDLGCGTGNLLRLLAEKASGAHIVGIERDSLACALAREKVRNFPHAQVVEQDLNTDQAFIFGESATLVVSCNVWYTLTHPVEALRATRNALVTGGRFVVTNPYLPHPEWIFAEHDRYMKEEATAEEREESIATQSERDWMIAANNQIAIEGKGKTAHFWRPDEWQKQLEGAGFAIEALEDDAYAGVNVLLVARAV